MYMKNLAKIFWYGFVVATVGVGAKIPLESAFTRKYLEETELKYGEENTIKVCENFIREYNSSSSFKKLFHLGSALEYVEYLNKRIIDENYDNEFQRK